MDKSSQEYLKEVDAIVADADSLRNEYVKLAEDLAACDVAKVGAKSAYEQGLAKGDENAMKAALRSIREANSKAEQIKKAMADFGKKMVTLRQRHEVLKNEIRPLREQADNAVRIAKERADEQNRVVDRVLGLLSHLNAVADVISAPTK